MLKKLDVLTFFLAVVDYDDEYLKAYGKRTYEKNGNVYALQEADEFLAFALLSGEEVPYITYLFTPLDLRGHRYASVLIKELQKEYTSLNCSLNEEWDSPYRAVFVKLLEHSGFVCEDKVDEFCVKTDDLRKWVQSPVWHKYKKYVERYRQRGWKNLAFAKACAEQRDYVMNSYYNDFESELDPKKILRKIERIDTNLSFILLNQHRLVAYAFITGTTKGNYVLSLVSTAKPYLGSGCVFLLYWEMANCLGQKSLGGKELRFYVRSENGISLKTAEHFCSQIKFRKNRQNYFKWI